MIYQTIDHFNFALCEIKVIDGLIDHHHRQGQRGADRAGGETAQGLL
jgi:hypothetical protein